MEAHEKSESARKLQLYATSIKHVCQPNYNVTFEMSRIFKKAF